MMSSAANNETINSFVAAAAQLPPGFLFRPSPLELAEHYLGNELLGQPLAYKLAALKAINAYDRDPDQLPIQFCHNGKRWDFFLYEKRLENNDGGRRTPNGCWVATGRPEEEIVKDAEAIAFKQTLVHYDVSGSLPAKTHWRMHEYRVNFDHRQFKALKGTKMARHVACEIYTKKRKKPPGLTWTSKGA